MKQILQIKFKAFKITLTENGFMVPWCQRWDGSWDWLQKGGLRVRKLFCVLIVTVITQLCTNTNTHKTVHLMGMILLYANILIKKLT